MTKKPLPPPIPSPSSDWASEIADVTPLGRRQRSTKTSPATPSHRHAPPAPHIHSKSVQKTPSFQEPPPTPHALEAPTQPLDSFTIVSNTAQRIAGHIQGLEPKLFKDLSTGKIPLSAWLDLHGWREADGIMMILNWLHEASHQGHRCVLLIVGKGKGYGEQGDMGIFRSQIARILSHHPRVMAFHTALPGDGGTGALYIYLKKNK